MNHTISFFFFFFPSVFSSGNQKGNTASYFKRVSYYFQWHINIKKICSKELHFVVLYLIFPLGIVIANNDMRTIFQDTTIPIHTIQQSYYQ